MSRSRTPRNPSPSERSGASSGKPGGHGHPEPTGYIGIVHQDGDSAWGIVFPDLPGCMSAADDFAGLPAAAAEAVALWCEVNDDAGHPRPLARGLAAIRATEDAMDAVSFLPVAAPSTARVVRLNITLPESLVQIIDARVGAGHRSGFLATAARQALQAADAT